MVVECAACHTRFKLADDKIKPGGTKVRCSRCKHVFAVLPPATAAPLEAPGTDDAAAVATPPSPSPSLSSPEPETSVITEPVPAPLAPEPATHPAAEDEIDFGVFNMQPVGTDAGDAEPAGGDVSGFGELDLGSFEESAPTPPTPAASEFAFEPTNEDESSADREFSLDVQEPLPPDEFEPPSKEAGPVEFAFEETEFKTFSLGREPAPPTNAEEIDEFALGDEELATPPGDPEEPEAFAFEANESFTEDRAAPAEEFDFGFGDEASAEFSFDSATPADFSARSNADGEDDFSWEEAEAPAEAGDDFNFDEPRPQSEPEDEFDFGNRTFDEPEPAAPAPPPPASVSPAPAAAARPAALEPKMPPSRPASPARQPERVAPPPHATAGRRRRAGGLFSRLLFLLALLLVAAGGAAVYFYWRGEIPQLNQLVDRLTGQQPPAPVEGEIRIEGLNSSYVGNRVAGTLLVIRGSAVNGFPGTRSSIALKAVLLDKTGASILQQTVFAGNPLDDKALKALPFAKIEESMNNPFGASLSNLNVPPGKAIPFTIVFRNLPAQVAEFTVEVVDSKPGTKP